MKNAITRYLMTVKAICPELTSKEMNYIESGLTVLKLKPKECYIQANSIQKEIAFISTGLLRAYYTDESNHEITVKFIKENEFAVHFSAFITQQPIKYSFKCVESSVLVNIGYEHIQDGYRKFPNMERYGRLVAEEVCKMQEKRIESFIFKTAEERYIDFLKESPDLSNRVSVTDLASYLGIERQSLTRLRKKILNIQSNTR